MTKEAYPECTLHKISEHVWWFTPESHTDRPSLCAVVGNNNVVILDIGASPHHTRQFLDELSANGINLPSYAILTHWHWDHVFGMSAIDCPIIAHEETAQNIQRMMSLDYSDDNLPNLVEEGHEVEFTREHMVIELNDTQRRNLILHSPDITFTQSLKLNLGDVTCDIQHVGGDHASDAVVIYIPEDNILFLGDCFYYTVYQEPNHYTQAKVLKLIQKLRTFDAETYILGHANELLSREDMAEEFDLIHTIYDLLEQHGTDKIDLIKAELYQNFDEEFVDDTFEPILEGLKLS